MLLVLPSLKTNKEEAVSILEEILRLGDNLLGIDPLAEVRSQEDGIERVRNACKEMRTRTKQWADDALLQVNGLFTRHVISSFQLINTTDLYPRLSHLRDILHSIKASGSQTDTPIDRGKAFQELHPKILRRCRKSFEIGQFDDAVFNALKTLEHEIRFRISGNPEDVGVNLVSKAMNPKEPLLVFSGVAAEQEATHALFRGAIGVFKNPLSHRFLDISDDVRAWEILTFSSLLMRLLDDAKNQSMPEDG